MPWPPRPGKSENNKNKKVARAAAIKRITCHFSIVRPVRTGNRGRRQGIRLEVLKPLAQLCDTDILAVLTLNVPRQPDCFAVRVHHHKAAYLAVFAFALACGQHITLVGQESGKLYAGVCLIPGCLHNRMDVFPSCSAATARQVAKVVLPTPPFWERIARTFIFHTPIGL